MFKNPDEEVTSVCIDMDSLFDTRLGTLATFGEKAVQKAFGVHYLGRMIDQFEGIDVEEFKTRYKNRGKTILRNSPRTEILDVALDFAFDTEINSYLSPVQSIPCIVVNTYPYVLNDEEVGLLMGKLVELTLERSDIRIIHMSPAELTPEFIRNEFELMIMYDYNEWLAVQTELGNIGDFKKQACPNVTLFGPDIYTKRVPTKAEIQQFKEADITTLKLLEQTVGPFIGLRLLPIKLFCVSCFVKEQETSPETQ